MKRRPTAPEATGPTGRFPGDDAEVPARPSPAYPIPPFLNGWSGPAAVPTPPSEDPGDRRILIPDPANRPQGPFFPALEPIPGPPVGDQTDFNLERLFEQMSVYLESRNAVAAQGPQRIASHLQETGYNVSATTIQVNARTSNTFEVTSIVACIPNGAGGSLQLGEAIIPLYLPVTVLAPVSFMLSPADTRQLVSSISGIMSLVLQGEQRSNRGLIR